MIGVSGSYGYGGCGTGAADRISGSPRATWCADYAGGVHVAHEADTATRLFATTPGCSGSGATCSPIS